MRSANFSIRQQASCQTREFLGRIIMLSLAAMLITSLLSSVGLFSSMSSVNRFTGLLEELEYAVMEESDPDAALEELGEFFTHDLKLLISYDLTTLSGASAPLTLLSAIGFLLSSVASTGFTLAMIRMADGQEVKCSILFSRWKHMLGAAGLPLWMTLKTLAWTIPGVLVWGLGASLTPSGLSWKALEVYEMVVMGISVALMLALAVPAALRYAMAPYVFADTPEKGVYDAVEYSKTIMASQKWRLFCLNIPYVLVGADIWFAFVLLVMAFSYIGFVAFTVYIVLLMLLAAIAATIYLSYLSVMAMACFYNEQKN